LPHEHPKMHTVEATGGRGRMVLAVAQS
jgi:hypothetical protein